MSRQYSGLLSPFLREQRFRAATPFLRGDVLDFACASGELAARIPPGRYVGVDIDSEALAEARVAHPDHRFEHVDDLDADARFDTVVALAVVEHLHDPDAWLADMAGRLRPAGTIVVTTPHSTWEPLHGLAAKVRLTSAHANEEHEETFDEESLRALASRNGLDVQHYRRFLARMNQLAVFTAP